MNRDDTQRLWAHVQWLLRQPSPPESRELRRAARLLAASRPDAVELLLAQWLAQTRDAAPQAAADAGPALEAGPVAYGAAPGDVPVAGPAAAPGRAAPRFGVREAALVTAGVAAGALVTGLLDAGDDIDADFGID